LTLYIDKNLGEKLALYTTADGLENTGELSWVKLFYECNDVKILLYSDFFRGFMYIQEHLLSCSKNKLKLHDSLQEHLLGFYKNQYRKKRYRKNLIYEVSDCNYSYWVGDKYVLFNAAGKGNPDSWLYNDKDGNIVFEITPVYPWFYSDPEPDETFLKYSEWMKTYQPYLKRVISKDIAERWLFELQQLISIVQKISKTLPCGGMVDCGGCIHLGKPND